MLTNEKQKEVAEMYARYVKDLRIQMDSVNPLGTMYEENIANMISLDINKIFDMACKNLDKSNYKHFSNLIK